MLMRRIFILLLLSFATSRAFAAPEPARLEIAGKQFTAYLSQPLEQANPAITRAIIVVHGSALNAENYFDTMSILAGQAKEQDSTFIIAPRFSDNSIEKKDRNKADLRWKSEGWLKGDRSKNGEHLSSFDLLDSFIEKLADEKTFPNLTEIVITGHSAGGQLTQRYAFGNRLDESLAPRIHFKYFVVNPGTYLYFFPERPIGVRLICRPKTNKYKFGLRKLNSYLKREDKDAMVSEYLNRDVTYVVGDQDVITKDLEDTCGARAQGETRLERAKNYKSLLDEHYPENNQPLVIIPGIGHTQAGMYRSAILSLLLFPIQNTEH